MPRIPTLLLGVTLSACGPAEIPEDAPLRESWGPLEGAPPRPVRASLGSRSVAPAPGGAAHQRRAPVERRPLVVAVGPLVAGRVLPRLEDAFEADREEIDLLPVPADVRDAVSTIIRGRTDAALVVGDLSDNERAAGLVEIPLGRVELALVAHPGVDAPSLLPDHVRALLTGRWPSWSRLGAAGGEDVTLVRPPSGPWATFCARQLVPGDGLGDGLVQATDEQVLDRVARTPGALGVVDARALVRRDDVDVLRIEGRSPRTDGRPDPRWPYGRTLHLVHVGTLRPDTAELLAFLRGR